MIGKSLASPATDLTMKQNFPRPQSFFRLSYSLARPLQKSRFGQTRLVEFHLIRIGLDVNEGKERMEVLLDVKPYLEKACRRGEHSVRKLKWIPNPAASVECIAADRLVALDPKKEIAFLGNPFLAIESARTGRPVLA